MACCSLSSLQFLRDSGVFADVGAMVRAAGIGAEGPPDPDPVEKIFHNGTFLLAVPARAGEDVSAIAILGENIVDVGDATRILAAASPTAEIIDLQGDTVAPGFIEAHAHLIMAIQGLYSLDLSYTACSTFGAVLGRIRDAVDQAGDRVDALAGDPVWVFGANFDPSLLGFSKDRGFPQLDIAMLDGISKTVPIFIMNASGHIAYANTLAFQLAHVTASTTVSGGSYGKNAKGELNGVMFEPPSFIPFMQHAPITKTVKEQSIPAMVAVLKQAQQRGVTTFHDPAIGVSGSVEELLKLYWALSGDPLRPTDLVGSIDLTSMYGPPQGSIDAPDGPIVTRVAIEGLQMPAAPGENGSYRLPTADGDHELIVPRVKFWTDGSTQGYTAYLTDAYLQPVTPSGLNPNGEADWTLAEVEQLLNTAKNDNWSVLMHANGDKAIDLALDAVEEVYGANSGFGNRIEHCTVTRPEQYDRLQKLGLAVTYLSNHIHIWGDTLRDNIIGPDRASRLDAAFDAIKHGIVFSYHCDYSVSQPDPLQYMETAVTRQTSTGDVLGSDQAIPPLEALKAVTIYSAMQLGLDGQIGTLEVGKYANLVQLLQDPTKVTPTDIAHITVAATWLRGRQIPVTDLVKTPV